MADPVWLRWESLAPPLGALALAIWALRDPESAQVRPPPDVPAVMRFRTHLKNEGPREVGIRAGAIVGRGTECDMTIDDRTVSKRHARVTFDGRPWIEDLGSTNGTFVNGRRLAAPTPLRRGDRIALGSAKVTFLGLASRGHELPKG